MEDAIVLYPSPGMGHLISMVELGKLILNHNPSFTIIILITTVPHNTGSTAPYISRVSATTPIVFHNLPTISLPPDSSPSDSVQLIFQLPKLNNPNLHQSLQTISQKSKIKASMIDFFCNASFEVFTSLDIPTYYFYTSGVSILAALLSLPTMRQTMMEKIKDVKNCVEFPGTPPIPVPDLPVPFFDLEGMAYKSFFSTAINMSKSSGIIANTWSAFQPIPIKAISDGLCTPDLPNPPPVHCIGPLIATGGGGGGGDENECMSWLDSQPSRSVVFLSFGSMGTFKAEQLKEMAIGLEKSGHRFLWVVRNPPSEGENKGFSEPDLDTLLPNGFLDRTRGRGLVVKSWAPQVAVLSHDSVGGFVTHCGWNSILEAVCKGVPMVAWPLYAEQKMNRVVLIEEMKVALAVKESEGGFVSAEELEERVKELMDSETGRAVRERVMALRDSAKAALGEDGASRLALAKLVESWKQG